MYTYENEAVENARKEMENARKEMEIAIKTGIDVRAAIGRYIAVTESCLTIVKRRYHLH